MWECLRAVELAAELIAAWLSNPNTRTSADDVPAFPMSIHSAVTKLAEGGATADTATEEKTYDGAATARKSLSSPDHIVSIIDGKKYKTLRRHHSTNGLTAEQYRERSNLKADYPMVSATYSDARCEMAKKIGLGRKPGARVKKAAGAAVKAVRKTGKATLDAAKAASGNEE